VSSYVAINFPFKLGNPCCFMVLVDVDEHLTGILIEVFKYHFFNISWFSFIKIVTYVFRS
jgi:hypothetical protein